MVSAGFHSRFGARQPWHLQCRNFGTVGHWEVQSGAPVALSDDANGFYLPGHGVY